MLPATPLIVKSMRRVVVRITRIIVKRYKQGTLPIGQRIGRKHGHITARGTAIIPLFR